MGSLGETKRRSQNLGVTPQNKASKRKCNFQRPFED